MLDYVINSLSGLDSDRIIVSVNSFFAPQFQDYLDSNTIEVGLNFWTLLFASFSFFVIRVSSL